MKEIKDFLKSIGVPPNTIESITSDNVSEDFDAALAVI